MPASSGRPPRSEHMEQSKDSPKPKSPEKKSAPQSNNLLWYLLGLGVLLLLLVTVWSSQNKLTIHWSDFEKLIEASNPKAPEGTTTYIIHVDKSNKEEVRWKLDQPRDIRIGSSEVTGTVMAVQLPGSDDASKPGGISAAESKEPKRIGFRVPSRPAAEERLLA